MEQEAREKDKKRQSESSNNLLTGEPVPMTQEQSECPAFVLTKHVLIFPSSLSTIQVDSGFATLDATHALCLPLGASISLLVMFFFFDSMQMLFTVCTASKYLN